MSLRSSQQVLQEIANNKTCSFRRQIQSSFSSYPERGRPLLSEALKKELIDGVNCEKGRVNLMVQTFVPQPFSGKQ